MLKKFIGVSRKGSAVLGGLAGAARAEVVDWNRQRGRSEHWGGGVQKNNTWDSNVVPHRSTNQAR